MSTPHAEFETRRTLNPLFNDNKLKLGLFGVNVSNGCAITSVAAGVCGLAHRKGRVVPGLDADLLAVDGDPLVDPPALQRVRAVYARGALVAG